jgi:DNA-binding beta-propeller fold protein YncE
MKRFFWLGFVLSLYLICTGCGDTFRPIIIPNPPVFPNPRASHTVVSINDNGTISVGSAMVIDVSGDTVVSIFKVGLAPVYAVQESASQVLVVNHSVSGPQNIGDSLTQLTFSGTTINNAATFSLPANSAPNFVAIAPTSRTAYVSLPNYTDPNTHAVIPSVGIVNTISGTFGTPPTFPVGNNPVALAITPDSSKLYVANEGDSTISGFNTVGPSERQGSPIGTSSPPIWLVARSDGQRVYALEASGTLASLEITSTAGPDTLAESGISVPGAARIVYDGNLNRLYISGGSQVAVVSVSGLLPSLIKSVAIPPVSPAARGAQDPCLATSVTTLKTIDVAPLPDGSRAYAGSYYEAAVDGTEYICPQVTVIDAVSDTVKGLPIAIPGFAAYDAFCSATVNSQAPRFRLMMAAGGDSSRAYLSSCDGGNVNVIDTSTDSYLLNLDAPVGTRLPIPPSVINPPQNPVFLIAGP